MWNDMANALMYFFIYLHFNYFLKATLLVMWYDATILDIHFSSQARPWHDKGLRDIQDESLLASLAGIYLQVTFQSIRIGCSKLIKKHRSASLHPRTPLVFQTRINRSVTFDTSKNFCAFHVRAWNSVYTISSYHRWLPVHQNCIFYSKILCVQENSIIIFLWGFHSSYFRNLHSSSAISEQRY